MSQVVSGKPRQPPVGESCGWFGRAGMSRLFEALPLAFRGTSILACLLGIILTFVLGSTLDYVWPSSSRPVVARESRVSELDVYLHHSGLFAPGSINTSLIDLGVDPVTGLSGPRLSVREWAGKLGASQSGTTTGIFGLLQLQLRRCANSALAAVFSLDPGGLWGAVAMGLGALGWLFSLHPVYGVMFTLVCFAIWGLCGGAAARSSAIAFARDDSISLTDALRFVRVRVGSFVLAPVLFPGFILLIGLGLWLMGLIAGIPGIEVVLAFAFVIAIILGVIACLLALLFFMTAPILTPAISTDDLDPWEAFSQALCLFWGKPWKYVACLLTSLVYGAISLVILKVVVSLALWLTGACFGSGMNMWDGQVATGDGKKSMPKLDAIWQPPQPGDNRPFIGDFETAPAGMTSITGAVMRGWLLLLWGLVAAFAVSFFYASGTIVYFIMRRDLHDTDMDDVYLEGSMGGTTRPGAAVAG